jgi:hypothetical protein
MMRNMKLAVFWAPYIYCKPSIVKDRNVRPDVKNAVIFFKHTTAKY